MSSFQIGPLDVDGSVLESAGRPLEVLAAGYGARVDEEGAPVETRDGWRVLRTSPSGEVILGAEEAGDPGSWRMARIAPAAEGERTVFVVPDAVRIRPGRDVRRAGLVLRWPSFPAADHAAAEWAIDIVNEGPQRWTPDGDGFHVAGRLLVPGTTSNYFAWAQLGRPTAVALDPGEYARVPVVLDSSAWSKLEPGDYELRALLTDLGMPAPALPVTVTADTIRRHRAATPGMRRSPEAVRRQHEFEVDRLRAQLAAEGDLAALVAALQDASSHGDATAAISEALGCDVRSAEVILLSPLRDLLPMYRPELERRLGEAEHLLAEDE
ncbi:hypothetical protein DVJ78_03705 [Humibacter sp. BT305]|nr:hypothetical protein DVJ78_03705 [Humibacter sp. BT305]